MVHSSISKTFLGLAIDAFDSYFEKKEEGA